jgi:hypothetical protein
MDGGRYRCRAEGKGHGVFDPRWRETKVGCLVRLASDAHEQDPHPEVPRLFLSRPRVQKLIHQLHQQKNASDSDPKDEELTIESLLEQEVPEESQPGDDGPNGDVSAPASTDSWRPRRLMRTCIASDEEARVFGGYLAAEAERRGFDQAPRKAFLGDGQKCNWTVQQRHFRDYIPIVDFVHLVSYVYGFAMSAASSADEGWNLYVRWIRAVWQGQAGQVLKEWRKVATDLQIPCEPLPDSHPRRRIQQGLSYLANNSSRIDYPRYRRLGLPVTSTLVESLIKEINYRVKGTEKFWDDPTGARAILTVRAALLSEDGRFDQFFAERPGCQYRRRSTLEKIEAEIARTAA